jgi:lysyl-tRNA synthetase class II
MGHFHLLINTSEDQPMRLFEFADAESQMELWKLITDSVWQAIAKQAQEQKQLDAQKANSASAAPKQSKPFKSKIVSTQPSKAKKTSAQEIQRQKVQSNAVKSKPKTTSVTSSSASSSVGKNQSNPLSVNQTEKMLDPLIRNPVVQQITK